MKNITQQQQQVIEHFAIQWIVQCPRTGVNTVRNILLLCQISGKDHYDEEENTNNIDNDYGMISNNNHYIMMMMMMIV